MDAIRTTSLCIFIGSIIQLFIVGGESKANSGLQSLFVVVIDVDNTLLYSSSSSSEPSRVNREGIEFLTWLRYSFFKRRPDSTVFGWTNQSTSASVVSALNAATDAGGKRLFFGDDEAKTTLPKVLDYYTTTRYGLQTNGIKDLGKLRRRLISFENYDITEHLVLLLLTPPSHRLYAFNVCYMQYHLLNAFPVILDVFDKRSQPWVNASRYHVYYKTVGEARSGMRWHRYRITQFANNQREPKNYRFHDVRRILEDMESLPEESNGPLEPLEKRLFESFAPSPTFQCGYTPTQPARIYTALVIDLAVIQRITAAFDLFFSAFLIWFLNISPKLAGYTVDAILFDCHRELESQFMDCATLRGVAGATLDTAFQTLSLKSNVASYSALLPFMDVVSPREFPSLAYQGIPKTMTEAVEYGIATRLPRRTTLLVKLGAEMPGDLHSPQYSTQSGGNHVCYSAILAEAEMLAERVRSKRVPGTRPRATTPISSPGNVSNIPRIAQIREHKPLHTGLSSVTAHNTRKTDPQKTGSIRPHEMTLTTNAPPAVEATTTYGPAVEATTTYGPAPETMTTYGPAVEATTTYEPAAEATTTYEPAAEATATYGPAPETMTTYGPAVEATTTYEPASEATATYGPAAYIMTTNAPKLETMTTYEPAAEATTTYEPAAEATATYGPAAYSMTTNGPKLETMTTYGPAAEATTTYGPEAEATATYGPAANAMTTNAPKIETMTVNDPAVVATTMGPSETSVPKANVLNTGLSESTISSRGANEKTIVRDPPPAHSLAPPASSELERTFPIVENGFLGISEETPVVWDTKESKPVLVVDQLSRVSREKNPLTRIEFLSELIAILGLLKRIRVQAETFLRVTPQTMHEAAAMLQKGLNDRVACYSFSEY